VHSASSQSYADVLRKQFSIVSHSTTLTADHTCPPPCKQHAASIINYDSDQLTNASSSTSTVTTLASSPCNSHPTPVTNQDHTAEIIAIKMEITALKTLITDAMDQFKTAIASLATINNSQSTKMETDVHESKQHHNNNQSPVDLAAIIQDLKKTPLFIVLSLGATVVIRKTHTVKQHNHIYHHPFS